MFSELFRFDEYPGLVGKVKVCPIKDGLKEWANMAAPKELELDVKR